MTDNPPPVQRSSPTPTPRPSTHQITQAMVRRARLEHLATELLCLGDALRLPVPIETVYTHPPLNLWRPPASPLPSSAAAVLGDAHQVRWETARAVAAQVSESAWPLRATLMGDDPLPDAEIDLLAVAVLLPTALLARLNERQRGDPALVANLFQAPVAAVTVRLAELGYLSPAARAAAQNDSTT